MNNGNYSDAYRQNQARHQHAGYHNSQGQQGSGEQRQKQQLGDSMNRSLSSQPQHIQDRKQQVLPPGWVEATDPSSGKVYYCNPKTRETTWERPTVPMTTAPEQQHQAKNSLSTARNPVSHHGAPLNQAQIQQQQKHQSQQNALPPGWVEAKDPSTGKAYYCNPKTRETSWERPVSTKSETMVRREEFEGKSTSHGICSDPTTRNASDNSDGRFDPNEIQISGFDKPVSSSKLGTPSGAKTNDSTRKEKAATTDFDELTALTTGQIAHLIKLQKQQQSAQKIAQSDGERQVQLSSIISNSSSNASKENSNGASLSPSNYVPIDLSLMASLSSTERTEPGRLDVRMYALRQELKKFGYGQAT